MHTARKLVYDFSTAFVVKTVGDIIMELNDPFIN